MKMRFVAIIAVLLCASSSFGATFFVDRNVVASGNGTTWALAKKTIQEAITVAGSGDEIWVRSGDYNEIRGGLTGALILKNGVSLYGGFDGTETARVQRDWTTNVTIINGINGFGAGNVATHVIVGASNATLDGFTVQNGQADDNSTMDGQKGGGMFNMNTSGLTIRNCVFNNNRANAVAGAILNSGASVTIEKTIFSNNEAFGSSNGGDSGGGAVCNDSNGNCVYTNCLFYGNRANGSGPQAGGGAVMNAFSTTATFNNCTFSSNSSSNNATSTPLGNVFAGGGDVMITLNAAIATVRNSIMWANGLGSNPSFSNGFNGGGGTPGSTTVRWSIWDDGNSTPPNTANSTADPQFLSPITNDYRISAGGSARDSAEPGTTPAVDLLGTSRPQGAQADRGAYEIDTTAPTCATVGLTANLDDFGNLIVTAENINDETITGDTGGVKKLRIRRLPSGSFARSVVFTCTDVGTQNVQLQVTDWAGNVSTCNTTVSVNDATEPTIQACPGDRQVALLPNCTAIIPTLTGELDVLATDNCSTTLIREQSPAALSTTAAGLGHGTVIPVTITVRDQSGNSANCSSGPVLVTLVDNTPPTISCPGDQVVPFNEGTCGATVPNLLPGVSATDNCTPFGSLVISQSPAAGDPITVDTTVTITVRDSANNIRTCEVDLTVADEEVPEITGCPPLNDTLVLSGACTVSLPNYTNQLFATDNCTAFGALAKEQTPPQGTLISADTVVIVTVEDEAGNQSSCQVNVNAVDETDPQITCIPNPEEELTAGCSTPLDDYTQFVSATDNCGTGGITLSQIPPANTIITDDTAVTVRATDADGNFADCNFTVIVVDREDPVITVCAPNAQADLDSNCQAVVPDFTVGVEAIDNCDTDVEITQFPEAGSAVTGDTDVIVTITATDDAGNDDGPFSTCQVTLDVKDINAPVINQCPGNTSVVLGTNCEAEMPSLLGSFSTSDNCGVVTETQDPPADSIISGPGPVTVTLIATDGAGNQTTCTATVTALDNITPTVSPGGCPADRTVDFNANCRAVVEDMTDEVVATDNCTASGDLVIEQTPAPGAQLTGASNTITFKISDSSGNFTTCTSTLFAEDNTAPLITLNGGNPMALLTGQTYVEPGAVVTDNCSTGLTAVVTGDTVNTTVPGTYQRFYNVTDNAGNVATQVTRTVVVTTNSPPEITVNAPNPLTHECGTPYGAAQDPGAIAEDDDQGVITGDIIEDFSGVNGLAVGTYQVRYEVTDNANTTIAEFRTVNVVDTTAPVITVVGSNPVTHECATSYVDAGATALDACDGPMTANIVVTNPIQPNSLPGTYTITYSVTDAEGNTGTATRTVNIVDTTIPTLTLIGGAQVNHECGEVYNDLGASADDTCVGNLTPLVQATISVNENSGLGTYTVEYNVEDLANNAAIPITRQVTVVDTTRPVITLNSTPTVVVITGQAYNEPGATAADTCDPDVDVTISGTVNTLVPGTYPISYNAVDDSGNAAITVVRNVVVQGTNSPPVFLQQPVDQTRNFDETATFSTLVQSQQAVTYQWLKDGAAISDGAKYTGTQTNTLTVLNVVNGDEGDYRLEATNQFGTTPSNLAELIVRDPGIVQQPTNQNVGLGGTATFEVVAVGSGTLTYQWFRNDTPLANGADIAGVDTPTLSISNADDTDEGNLYVQVTGADGTIQSTTVLLNVSDPFITDQPDNLTLNPGQTAVFQIQASGTAPLFYQWKKNGININSGGRFSGADTNTLTIASVVEGDEASYTCVVIGEEIVSSNPATLTVNDPPAIDRVIVTPSSGVAPRGQNIQMVVTLLRGTPPLSYQWFKDGDPISDGKSGDKAIAGSQTATLLISNAQESDEGSYTVEVSNIAGEDISDPVNVGVGLTIFANLTGRTVSNGSNLNWTIQVGGAQGALSFQWQKQTSPGVFANLANGPGISGTNTGTLVLTGVDNGDAGFYRVLVSDSVENATSNVAQLVVVSSLPAVGGLGLVGLSIATALAGAFGLRRKQRK